jgi:hypothetical protein
MALARWGMEPARKRWRSVALLARAPAAANPRTSGVAEPGLKGLVDGVGREVLGVRAATVGFSRPGPPAVVKREGSVPARVLPLNWLGALPGESGRAWAKSGKLSPCGDSGMESLSGVEWPLVGGPQIWGVMPS